MITFTLNNGIITSSHGVNRVIFFPTTFFSRLHSFPIVLWFGLFRRHFKTGKFWCWNNILYTLATWNGTEYFWSISASLSWNRSRAETSVRLIYFIYAFLGIDKSINHSNLTLNSRFDTSFDVMPWVANREIFF